MNRYFKLLVLFFVGCPIQAQSSTEVYVVDIINTDGKITLSNPINISDNEGYDSQPFFMNSDEILFSSNRNGQTDLIKYNLKTNQKEWILNTSASEYSPTLTPENNAVSYIKLEENGTQLLWSYNLQTQKEEILIPNLKIGYHVWFDGNTIASFVLGEPHTLQITDLKSQIHVKVDENIGRSLHKIPNQNLISYVSKKKDNWNINSLNPIDGTITLITEIPFQAEDLTWKPSGDILLSYADIIYVYNPDKNKTWQKVFNLKTIGLNGLTRLAISPNEKKLAVVVQGK